MVSGLTVSLLGRTDLKLSRPVYPAEVTECGVSLNVDFRRCHRVLRDHYSEG